MNNNKKDVTKNGYIFWVHGSRVQASRRPESSRPGSKYPGVQSPSVQASRVIESSFSGMPDLLSLLICLILV